jgi:hypothetical protein
MILAGGVISHACVDCDTSAILSTFVKLAGFSSGTFT